MTQFLLFHIVFVVTVSSWVNDDEFNWYWHQNSDRFRTPWDAFDSRIPLGRQPRAATTGSRFSLEKLRNDVQGIERNYWCYVYQICHYFDGYHFLTALKNESVVYYNAIKAVLSDKYGDKVSTPRTFTDESKERGEKKAKIENAMNLLADSWANLLGEFSKSKVSRNPSGTLLNWFSRIVDKKTLDETVSRANEVLGLWPKQFLKVNSTKRSRNYDDYNQLRYLKTDSFGPMYGFPSQNYGQFHDYVQLRNSRYRRSANKEIETWYSKPNTVKEATVIMKNVFGYVFNCDPELFASELDFLEKRENQLNDTAIIAFKRILTDSYGVLLKNKNIAQGPIITKRRVDMEKKMKNFEDNIKDFWANQMELLSKQNTQHFAKEARKLSTDFIHFYVRVVPFEQAQEAYRRLEELNNQTNENNNDLDMTVKG